MTTSDDTSASFGGSAAAARSMELLWGTKPPPSRGRKPGMTIERIVAAAIEVADAEGLDGLSMRRVADALGVGTMSLYRYVPSKAELHDLMLDTVTGEDLPMDLTTGGWRAGLTRFATLSLDGYLRHQWLLRASLTRGAMGPNQTAALDSVLAAIDGIGLTGGEKMALVELVTSYARGVAQQRIDAAIAHQRSGLSDEQFWTDFAPLLDSHLDEHRFPALTTLFRAENVDWVDSFDFGLARILDGIERLVQTK
ncbi:TetR/AcrR family transcriptional regulator [Actinophytocola sediminis]